MEQFDYERPREKLVNRGVKHLTNTELIQVVIGSGNKKVSAPKLSRKISDMFSGSSISYKNLVAIDGIGDAKACQIIAAIELGKRANSSVVSKASSVDYFQDELKVAQKSSPGQILVWGYDGGGLELSFKSYVYKLKDPPEVIIRKIYLDLMSSSVKSVYICFRVGQNEAVVVSSYSFFVGKIKETAKLFNISVTKIMCVGRNQLEDWTNIS